MRRALCAVAALVAAGAGCGQAPASPAATEAPPVPTGTLEQSAPSTTPSVPPTTTAPPTDGPWGADVWFADGLSREAFVTDELRPLLGEPTGPVGSTSALAFDAPGRYTYTSPVGDQVPVLALAPGGEPAVGDPAGWDVSRGLVVALHQTNLEGPIEPCDPDPTQPLAYGAVFAADGYVVICPNLAFTGERQPDNQWDTAALYAAHPGWSAMGKDVAEVSWLLDAVSAAGVAADRVAVVGHSQGAVYSLYAGALDDRIDVVVANAGYVDSPTDPEPERWSRPAWYRGFRELPVGLDMLEVVGAIAPKCALLTSYADDDILVATAPEPARLASFEERYPSIDWTFVDGPHDWPARQLANAERWLSEAWERCTV